MKFAMASITVVLAVLVGLWFGYVHAPPPAEVCEHIIQVTMAQSAAKGMSPDTQAAVLGSIRDQCVEHKRDKILLRGRIQYAAYAKCALAASTLGQIEKC